MYDRAAGVLTKQQKDTVSQKIVRKYLGFSMLFRGLGRPGALTLATPQIFSAMTIDRKEIEK